MDNRTQKILELSQAGNSQSQIAGIVGLTQTRVGQILRSIPGWKCPTHWSEERKQDALNQYISGLSVGQIAKVMKTNRRHVRAVVLAAGLSVRPCRPFPKGEDNPAWAGGKTILGEYLYKRDTSHPNATRQGYVAEHRRIMSAHLGRPLRKGEVVHHINGDTQDNRLENLCLFASNADHLRATLKGKVPNWTPEGKSRMGTRRPAER